jgi:hypothetical protein
MAGLQKKLFEKDIVGESKTTGHEKLCKEKAIDVWWCNDAL